MARIGGSVSRYWRRLSRAWLVAGALGVALPAHASQSVVVHTTINVPEPLVGRLCAELASAGYAVSLQLSEPPVACRRSEGTWVALAPDPVQPEAFVATICFEGTQVAVLGPRREPTRFAISAAEALNGLRATGPRHAQHEPQATSTRSSQPLRSARHAVSVGQSLVVDPAEFPPQWGATLELELGLGAHTAVVLEGFFPITRSRTSTQAAELSTGVTFLRLGPIVRFSLARFALAGSLLAGPAYTWVTATADRPYIAQTDGAPGILASAGLAIAYPDRSSVFAMAASRASLLLPSPRIQVPGEAARDFGPVLVEASLSVGMRF